MAKLSRPVKEKPGRIIAKMNSLVDPDLIAELLPGIPGRSQD